MRAKLLQRLCEMILDGALGQFQELRNFRYGAPFEPVQAKHLLRLLGQLFNGLLYFSIELVKCHGAVGFIRAGGNKSAVVVPVFLVDDFRADLIDQLLPDGPQQVVGEVNDLELLASFPQFQK